MINRVGLITVLAATAATLAGCSSTPVTRFHSLLPAPEARATEGTMRTVGKHWELAVAAVPTQVDRPQWVLRLADGSLQTLEHERWIAPLADEIRAAVVLRIDDALAGIPAGKAAARWRVALDVLRFEAVYGRFSRIDAAWTVERAGAPEAVLHCRGSVVENAGNGVAAMANAHRLAVAQLGDRIGASLRAALRGQLESGC